MKAPATAPIGALDPERSFIVEAPAGSGKTELLIQRFLALLSRVERPEQVIAITFTRKAAAEMRQRVMESLRIAAGGSGHEDLPPHRRDSIELAATVVAHADRLDWSLPDQPQRLRITTIDALNAALARQMPLASDGIANLGVADDAKELYAEAARRLSSHLADSEVPGAGLRMLLQIADNSIARLERWLAELLPQRDRWMRLLGSVKEPGLAELLADSFNRLREQRASRARDLIAPPLLARLLELMAERDANLGIGARDIPDGAAFTSIARLLLTSSGAWRKRFTRSEGFPADNKDLARRIRETVAELHDIAGLEDALRSLAALPDEEPGPGHIESLDALTSVLPRLLAELRLAFARQKTVDHVELALAAQTALGTAEDPSELLLALDRRIEHVLVDEFQDTSHLQWRLLELLTAGWQTGDGRTLFLVGDPMQSIYRFRDADVSLFVRAQRHGLGELKLHPFRLTQNHRSAREIVAWVNQVFTAIFPDTDSDIAASYRQAHSHRAYAADAGVELHLISQRDEGREVSRIVDILRREIESDPKLSIAVLVRSRQHLLGLREALRHEGLAAHAVEIDSLLDTQLGQDLISLTAALAHHGDRLSWLGVLRSPWCGLGWSDVVALGIEDPSVTIRERLAEPNCLQRLSPEGRIRAGRLRDKLAEAESLRAGASFGRWIRATWVLLDGPAALRNESELATAESFFAGLEQFASAGDVDDPAALRQFFARPLPHAAPAGRHGIEIMTIHRAKGLEFDTVILPGLGRRTRDSDSRLLIFNDFVDDNDARLSLAAVAGSDPLYEFLLREERQREAAERGRLLYVAATRTRRRLHLLGSIDPERQQPRAGSLLATLWPGLDRVPELEQVLHEVPETPQRFVRIPLRALAVDDALPESGEILSAAREPDSPRPDYEWVHPATVQIGTLIHRELQRLSESQVRAGVSTPPVTDRRRYRRELALLGVEPDDLDAAAARVEAALDQVWSDPTGRWILEARPEAWSELRLTVLTEDRLQHLMLDRSFVDEDGNRWIIDYKTGRHLGLDIDAFLNSEVERYRDQLYRYARAVAETDSRPIRLALYFPLLSRLKEIDWPGDRV